MIDSRLVNPWKKDYPLSVIVIPGINGSLSYQQIGNERLYTYSDERCKMTSEFEEHE